jgi:hypothetical protein
LERYAPDRLACIIVAENDEEKMKPYSAWQGCSYGDEATCAIMLNAVLVIVNQSLPAGGVVGTRETPTSMLLISLRPKM